MAYKHLIQKDVPIVTYPLDQKSSSGAFDAYSLYVSDKAYVVDSSGATNVSYSIPAYDVPLVNGNNISSYLGDSASTKLIRTPAFSFFTEKTKNTSYCLEFWTRLSPSDISGTEKWLMRTGFSFANSALPIGIVIKDQHINFRYGNAKTGTGKYQNISIPIDKFNQPLHIVVGVSKTSIFISCNGIKVAKNFVTIPTLNTFDSTKDYLYFGDSYASMEISCISLYDYILEDKIIYQHYLKGQGYSVPNSYYTDLNAYIYSMNLQNDQIKYFQSKNTTLNANSYTEWNSLITSGALKATSGLNIDSGINSIFMSSNNKNFDTNFVKSASDFSGNNTASGRLIQKGRTIEIAPVSSYTLDSTENFWIETKMCADGIYAAGASATLYYLYSERLPYIWIHQERATATTNVTRYNISDAGGQVSSSGYLSGSIAAGEFFAIGIAKYSDGIYIYQKTGVNLDNTSSYSFGIGSTSNYSFLSKINSIRIGAKTDPSDKTVAQNDETTTYLGYVNSIKWGYPFAYINNDNTLPYHLIQYNHSDGQAMKYGVYNEKLSIEKIPLTDIAQSDGGTGYKIYNNRVEFSFPDQDDVNSKSNAIQLYLNSYANNILTSSVRILSSSQAVVYPASYASTADFSASSISFDIYFNTDDIQMYPAYLSYFKFYGLKSASISGNNSGPNISLFNNYNNNLGMIPVIKRTPFINNSIKDSGILFSGSGNYAQIPFSFSTPSITAISSYIYLPTTNASFTQSPVFSINDVPILTITNSGASINVNTSSINTLYINGASVTLSSGSAAFYKDRWVFVGINLTNPINNSSGSILTIGSKNSAAIPYFIDEIAFIGKSMTDQKFASLYSYQVSGTASIINIIKDGASATYDMQKTYGSTSSAKVAIALMDKEKPEPASANLTASADGAQYYTNETINEVKALLTGTITINSQYPANNINRYVDGYKVQNNDKILFSPTATINNGSAGIYIATVDANDALIYTTSGSTAFSQNQVFFVANGDQYGDIYCSAEKISGSLSLNIFEDRFKVKYIYPQ